MRFKAKPSSSAVRLGAVLWRIIASTELSVVLCFMIALDTALAYPIIKNHLTTFLPLGEMRIFDWLATYGRFNLGHTAWFFILMGLLSLLGLNTLICTTIRVRRLVRNRAAGWFWKLGPQVMHYAVLVILTGYLLSYATIESLPGRALIPGGPPLKLSAALGSLSATVENPRLYQGSRLDFFDGWYLDPGFILELTTPDGNSFKSKVKYGQPALLGGYHFYLTDFHPKNSAWRGMGSDYMTLAIRRDRSAFVYLTGLGLFILGLGIYGADFFRKKSA
jgi:hypothetical protein